MAAVCVGLPDVRHPALAGRHPGGEESVPPPQAIIMSAVTAATNALAAHSAAHLGQARVALDGRIVGLICAPGGSVEAARYQLTDTAVTVIDPNDFLSIAADLAYVRGMAHRQLDEEDKAQIWLSKATINGALIESARDASWPMSNCIWWSPTRKPSTLAATDGTSPSGPRRTVVKKRTRGGAKSCSPRPRPAEQPGRAE